MAKKTVTVLQPDFYKDFGCVGAACRHNCCRQLWTIEVDKTHYKKLRALREPKWLAGSFGDFMKQNPACTSEANYALLQQREQGGCLFQTEDGLCRIHAELGPEYLCSTCQTYPRSRTLVPGDLAAERGLCSSCEEVARQLLAHPEPILFEQHTEVLDIGGNSLLLQDIGKLVVASDNPFHAHYLSIRAVLIALLQAREYTLDERMMLVALLLDKLMVLEESEQPDAVPQTLDTFVAAVQSKAYGELLNKKIELDVARLFANHNWAYAFASADSSKAPALLLCEQGVAAKDYVTRIARYQAFAAERGHLVEHVLVTALWNDSLPFHGQYSIRQNLYGFVSTYAVLRFYLAGCLAAQDKLSDTELIDCVAYFGKRVLHGRLHFSNSIELLRRNDMTSLAYLLAIIKG